MLPRLRASYRDSRSARTSTCSRSACSASAASSAAAQVAASAAKPPASAPKATSPIFLLKHPQAAAALHNGHPRLGRRNSSGRRDFSVRAKTSRAASRSKPPQRAHLQSRPQRRRRQHRLCRAETVFRHRHGKSHIRRSAARRISGWTMVSRQDIRRRTQAESRGTPRWSVLHVLNRCGSGSGREGPHRFQRRTGGRCRRHG